MRIAGVSHIEYTRQNIANVIYFHEAPEVELENACRTHTYLLTVNTKVSIEVMSLDLHASTQVLDNHEDLKLGGLQGADAKKVKDGDRVPKSYRSRS